MDNTPDTPPPAPSTHIPAAPKLLIPRPGAVPGTAPAAGAPPKPAFKPAPTAAGLPPPPSFAKPAGTAQTQDTGGIEMNFTEEDDGKEPVALVAVDILALAASVAFAVMLFMQMSQLGGK